MNKRREQMARFEKRFPVQCWMAVLAASVALLVTLGRQTTSLAQTPENTASVTIQNRACPLEFRGTDYFGECHDDPIPRMPFLVNGPVSRQVETDTTGDGTFAALPPGTYEIVGGPPGDFVRNTIRCGPATAPGTRFPFRRISNSGIEVDLAAGDQVICDWFSVPEYRGTGPTPTPDPTWTLPTAGGESVTLQVARCPAAADRVNDCESEAGAHYEIEHLDVGARLPASDGFDLDGDEGIVTFDLGSLGPGRIRIVAAIPQPVDSGIPGITCTAGQGAEVRSTDRTEPTPNGVKFDVVLRPGDQIRCDIIYFP